MELVLCEVCGLFYSDTLYLSHIESVEHNVEFVNYFIEIESAANCRLKTFLASNPNGYENVEEYLESLRSNIIYYLSHYLTIHNCLKYNLVFECYFYKADTLELKNFKTANVAVFKLSDLNLQYSSDINKLLLEIEDLNLRGSGYAFYNIHQLQLRINKYEPIRGGGGNPILLGSRYPIPKFIKNKKSIVNPYRCNKKKISSNCCDSLCFRYSIMGKLLFDSKINVHNIMNYFRYNAINNKYNWDCIPYPVALEDIQTFERVNDITINVYSVNDTETEIIPLKVNMVRKKDHRDILFFKGHFTWIKSFNTLISKQVVKKNSSKRYFCRTCFRHYYQEELLITHEKTCTNSSPIITIKKKEKYLKFKNIHRQLKIPYVIYADVKYELTPLSTCTPNPNASYTHPIGIYSLKRCLYCVVYDNTMSGEVKYFSDINSFITSLENDCKRINKIYNRNVPPLNKPPQPRLGIDLCHICDAPLQDKYVLDHDHITGRVRGYAHNFCNLSYRLPNFVPVVISDLSKINSNPILEYYLKSSKRKVRIIPYKNKTNQFISLNVSICDNAFSMRFVDFSKFLDFPRGLDFIQSVSQFEKIRNICFEQFKLDILYYVSVGSYSFDCMLKYTGVNLEIIQDVDMFLFVTSGIRGGLVSCIRKHAIVNNLKLLPSAFDPSKPESSIYFFDVIGLYSYVMAKYPLPIRGFRWVENVNELNLNDKTTGIGYILEVDITYPKEIQPYHEEFPLCPHYIEGIGLIASFKNKTNYIVHSEALRQAISMGLKVTKIHRAIQFEENYWLSKYVDLNSELRRKYSTQEGFSNFFKVMNNVIFGKSIENHSNRLCVQILKANPRALMRLIKKPTFYDRIIINEHSYIVMNKKEKTTAFLPVYLGMSILDLSKVVMYNLFYKELKRKLPKCELLYSDTDSFVLEIYASNEVASKYFNEMRDVLHLDKGPGPLGKLKNICPDASIVEFVGHRSKVYGYRCFDNSFVLKNIPPNFNFSCYTDDKLKFNNSYIRAVDNSIYKLSVSKSMSPAMGDKKRVLCSDNNHTLPLA